MGNLIRMDLYRMRKTKAFQVCLVLAFVFAFISTPMEWLLYTISKNLVADANVTFPETANLTAMISSPASSVVVMLALLSIVSFFHADMEAGYIKNIAGQMPRRGYTILSRFLAAIPHNLLFLLIALGGNIVGTILFRRIIIKGSIPESILVFLLKLLLMQSLCSILLLVTATFRNKSLGMILAVLLGLPLMTLIYAGINAGLGQLFKGVDITPYLPDEVLREPTPGAVRALLVAAVTIGIFLPLSTSVFDKRDVR